MIRLQQYLSNENQRNALFILLEVIWSGVFAVVNSFISIYAIRLGATNTEIGLLSSLPALLTILVSIAAARFLEKSKNPLRWTFGSLLLYRAGFLLLPLIPLVPFLQGHQGTAAIVLIILFTIPLLVYNIGLWPFYIRVIPVDRRATIFSTQNFVSNLVTGLGVVLVGYLLDRFLFPRNYQVMITVGVALSLLSLYCFKQVRIPAESQEETPDPSQKPSATSADFRKLLSLRTDFGRVVFNQVFQYIGVWAATPLMAIYTVKVLSASDSWLGLNNSVLFFGQLAGWLVARKLIQRFGEPLTLKWTSQLPILQPLLMGLSPALTPILFVTALMGLLHPSYSLSHNNTLLRTLPAGKEHEGIAVYHTINRIGIVICPIIGVAVSEWLGDVRVVLIACGLISLVGSLSFHIWPVFQDDWKQRANRPGAGSDLWQRKSS